MLIISLVFLILGMIASFVLKTKFRKYYHTPLSSGITGAKAAQMMLRDNGIYDVSVICVEGELTDHYNPMNKTVNLSEPVFYGYSAASVAIAAHECGHALQHARSYAPLQFRSMMVPVQNFAAQVMNIFILLSIFGGIAYLGMPIAAVLLVIIAAYGIFTLFSFLTLPVEIDASRRALQWMQEARVVNQSEKAIAFDALKWAAFTYVIAALGSLAGLIYYVMAFMGINNRD